MKKKSLNLSEARNSYLMPYIAVMTILCIFFMIQYSNYSREIAEKEADKKRNMAQDVREDLKELENVEVEVIEDGIKVTLPSSLMFDKSVAGIKPAVLSTLKNLSESIKKLNEEYLVVVDGHTDDEPVFYGGDFSSNWELSLYRSMSVIDFFVREGNNPDLFAAAGHGEFSPVFPNDTPSHKAANRRVEIFIRKKSKAQKTLKELLPAGLKPEKTAETEKNEPDKILM